MATHWRYESPAQSGPGTRWRRTNYAQDGAGNRRDYTGLQDLGASFTMADVLIAPPGILPNGRQQITVSDYLEILQATLPLTGVTPGTYGDGSHYPVLVVDANGRVTGASQDAVPASIVPASCGLAANRPTATGSGRVYLCTDVPCMYVDDSTAGAWIQFNVTPTPAGPSLASYTLVGKMGAAQYADCIRASVYDQSANIASCALAAGSLGASSMWVVTLAASFLSPSTTFPGLGLCVANGTTSGTSDLWEVGVYSNGATFTLHAKEAVVGGTIVGSDLSTFTVSPAQLGNGNLIHLRLLADGTNLHFQFGDGIQFFDLYTMATPSSLTNYGFVMGEGGNASARCMSTVFSNTLTALTVPQSTVSNVAAGTPGVVTTSAAHGLVSGDWVAIHGVGGSSGVNTSTGTNWASGAASIHVTGPTTFELVGITVTGTYTSGGTVTCVSR